MSRTLAQRGRSTRAQIFRGLAKLWSPRAPKAQPPQHLRPRRVRGARILDEGYKSFTPTPEQLHQVEPELEALTFAAVAHQLGQPAAQPERRHGRQVGRWYKGPDGLYHQFVTRATVLGRMKEIKEDCWALATGQVETDEDVEARLAAELVRDLGKLGLSEQDAWRLVIERGVTGANESWSEIAQGIIDSQEVPF